MDNNNNDDDNDKPDSDIKKKGSNNSNNSVPGQKQSAEFKVDINYGSVDKAAGYNVDKERGISDIKQIDAKNSKDNIAYDPSEINTSNNRYGFGGHLSPINSNINLHTSPVVSKTINFEDERKSNEILKEKNDGIRISSGGAEEYGFGGIIVENSNNNSNMVINDSINKTPPKNKSKTNEDKKIIENNFNSIEFDKIQINFKEEGKTDIAGANSHSKTTSKLDFDDNNFTYGKIQLGKDTPEYKALRLKAILSDSLTAVLGNFEIDCKKLPPAKTDPNEILKSLVETMLNNKINIECKL